ncbi:hypothetical protein ACHAPT_006763 [Fusarium lateritium]
MMDVGYPWKRFSTFLRLRSEAERASKDDCQAATEGFSNVDLLDNFSGSQVEGAAAVCRLGNGAGNLIWHDGYGMRSRGSWPEVTVRHGAAVLHIRLRAVGELEDDVDDVARRSSLKGRHDRAREDAQEGAVF